MKSGAIKKIYTFWFSLNMKEWFSGRNKKVDAYVRSRYDHLIVDARSKKLDHWKQNPTSLLCLILLLDQFPRHAYRGTYQAYTHSSYAIEIAYYGYKHYLRYYNATEIMFLLLPFQHSEVLLEQQRGIRCHYAVLRQKAFRSIQDLKTINTALYHQIQHFEVISEFGRFPKRNASIRRTSTQSEQRAMRCPCARVLSF